MKASIIRLIFPPKCIFCGQILNADSEMDICSSCFVRIPFMSPNLSKKLRTLGYIDDIVCVCEYNGIIKDSLIRYKFFNKPGYYRAFGILLADRVKKMTNYVEFDIIISVPLYKDRELTRGYNQSNLISKVLVKELGISGNKYMLTRIRNTRSQSLLEKDQRGSNVHGAFQIKKSTEAKDKSILLVDDIMTTGSTLDECAKVLKEAGAKNVTAAVIASGRKF